MGGPLGRGKAHLLPGVAVSRQQVSHHQQALPLRALGSWGSQTPREGQGGVREGGGRSEAQLPAPGSPPLPADSQLGDLWAEQGHTGPGKGNTSLRRLLLSKWVL